jgi:hypothetical protein
VIGPLVRGDHAERDIVDARPLDHARRTPPNGVRVEQQNATIIAGSCAARP